MNELYEKYLQKIPLNGLGVCRFCIEAKQLMTSISMDNFTNSEIFKLFKNVTNIKLEMSADYPAFMCSDCEYNLRTSAENIRQFREVNLFWKHYLTNTSVSYTNSDKSEIVPVVEQQPPEHQNPQQYQHQQEKEDDSIHKIQVKEKVKKEKAPEYDENEEEDDNSFDDAEYFPDIKPHFVQVEMFENENRTTTTRQKSKRRRILHSEAPVSSAVPYECATCGKGFYNKTNLSVHLQQCGVRKKTYTCTHCGEKYQHASQLQKHLSMHAGGYNCPICSKSFPSNRHLKTHVLIHKRTTAIVEGMFSCTACTSTFSDKLSFREHVRSTHLPQQAVQCSICEKMCISQSRLRKHMIKRHNAKPKLHCFHCEKSFDDKNQLKQHMRTHSGGPAAAANAASYVCEVCGHEFKTLTSVNRHSLTHTADGSQNFNTIEKRRNTTGLTSATTCHLQCPLCEKSFHRCSMLRDHLRKMHPFDGPLQWEQMLTTMCLKCNEMFPSVECLRDHKEMHKSHTQHQCDVCKQFFTSPEALKYHLLTHSKKERPYKCTLCGASYMQNTHLGQHHRRVHTKERPHKCIVCSKTFVENYELVKHTRIVHMQERRFPCKDCDKSFKKSGELKIHVQSHTGVYRYRCEPCNKGFGNSTLFATHNATNHPELANAVPISNPAVIASSEPVPNLTPIMES